MSADGQLARCQRVEQGAFKTATDKTGQTYYLHRLNGEQRPRVEMARHPSGPKAERAPTDVLATVYDALLWQLCLSASHREQLRKRGLPDAEIDRRLYRSLPVKGRAKLARELAERFGVETLPSVPGFVVKQNKKGADFLTIAGSAGLLIPVRNSSGRIVALKVRRDDDGDGPRYSYLSSTKFGGPGPGSPVHVPCGIATPAAKIRLTEGELKADVTMFLSGTPSISVPGVASWEAAIPILHQLGAKTVLLAFDADAAEKPTVARALAACAEGLTAKGFVVEIEKWDAAYKGIDDALAAGQTPEVLQGDEARAYVAEVLAKATANEPPPPPNPLDRLDNVLSERGAEALFRDAELLKALAVLAERDPSEFACKRARLKNAAVSLRDFDRSLSPYRQALRVERPPLTSAGEYRVSGGKIVHLRPTKDGPVEIPLCNFNARIVEQVTIDDGAEESIRLVVEGNLFDGMPLPRVEIPAEKFGWMGWTIAKWGTRPVVNAGASTTDHLRCALQLLSGDVQRRTVYGHLGWRKIGDQWAYLHANGAIGPNGVVNGIEVAPPDALTRYVLPAPPSGEGLLRAVRASLALLDFGPPRLIFPLLSAVYRAVLGNADFALHLMGQTGIFKSELAALMQQHFGPEMDSRHLPASWASTGNALESIAFAAKDALLTVDDFAPQGGPGDVARLHREAERLLRAQGNSSGRQRMRADGTLRPARPPRGLSLSTGEDMPRGQSLRGRLFTIEMSNGDVDKEPLTAAQQDAASGLYAKSMAAFVKWLARHYDQSRSRLAAERAQLRQRAVSDGQHARTPGIIADLSIGLRYLLDFAEAIGVIDAARRREQWERGWAALCEAGSAQAQHIESSEPTGHFRRLLAASLASGRVHLAATDGGSPEMPSAWGWRREDSRDGPKWHPQGRRVGWIDGDAVLLEPEASYAAAQEMAGAQGESLAVSAPTLRRRLKEKGLLASWDADRKELTIRRTLEGVRRKILHLHVSSLEMEPAQPAHEGEIAEENGRVAGRFAGRENENPPANPPTNPPTNDGENVSLGGLGGSEKSGDATTGENHSIAYLADGETYESTRTPFDSCNDEDAQPIRPLPTAEPKLKRYKADTTPDLFADRENSDNE